MGRIWALKTELLSAKEFSSTWAILNQGINDGVFPGAVAGLWQAKDPGKARLVALGHRRTVPSLLPMLPDTVFDLASITKVFATATLAALLVDRRWLQWETPVKSIFADYASPEVQIRHLLSHTAGLPAWLPLWERLREQFSPVPLCHAPVLERQYAMKKFVLSVLPEVPTGQRALYSDLSFLLLGFVLEEIVAMPLSSGVEELVWKPMGLEGAFFSRVDRSVQDGRIEKAAATENCSWRGGVLQGQVHDDNCWAMGGYAGHAGAFARAKDVLQFVAALFSGFLSPDTLQTAWNRVSEPHGCERTLGWDTPSGNVSSAGKCFSSRSVGHLGFTGTSLWVDLDAGIAVTLLTNRVHPSRENERIKSFRAQFHDAIRCDIENNRIHG
jgi:serine-type D-Ala-D-Ala carboxypeptidase